MDCLTWNNSIAAHFFKPEMAGSTIHLYVTEKLITDIGQERGADFSDFIAAIKRGPTGVTRQGLCVKALQSRDNWQQRELDYPPYIAYLALFVLAAGIEGDFATNSYYPRLRTLLGEEPTTGQYPSFNRMSELWEDLEKWSNQDKSGELGIFNSHSIGNRKHIGLPLAQTLLTEVERRALPAIFAAADLDPISHPTEEAIALLLTKHGRKLRKRTLDLLKETSDSYQLRQALLEWIIDELRDWDGTAELSDTTQIYGLLRLCCKLDLIAKRATLSLRCSTKHEFPEDDFLLSLEDNSQSFSCSEYSGVWSLPLRYESDGKTVAGSEFDWLKGVKMRSADSQWCFKLPASPIRVFVNGETEGLPDFVEVRQIPTQKPFYLAAHQDCLELLTIWGELSCQGFEKLAITDGLPREWHLFKAAVACSDELIKYQYPILAFPTNVRLELSGGLRLERGNKFFEFAPPTLILQSGSESIKLYCNNQLLQRNNSAGNYELPTDIPAETKLLIEAKNGEEIIRRCSLLLIKNYSLASQLSAPQFDRFGRRLTRADNESAGVAGALVRNLDFPDFNFNTFLPIQGQQRILFVGKEPGQITTWPGESLPTDWEPVWAISKGRHRGQVMFCGTNLSESEPALSQCRNRKKMREWKEVLWHDRKKVSPPDPKFRALWNKFQKEAERVGK